MARHANVQWNLPEGKPSGGTTVHSYEAIHSALLMDIRDELQKLNALLHCPNFVGIPTTLTTISRKMPVRRVARKKR